jgi:phosphomevalonate kinase
MLNQSDLPTDSKNKFVYYALKYTLILASERLSAVGSARSLRASLQHGLDIAAVGDNDFYSQQAKVIIRFLIFGSTPGA